MTRRLIITDTGPRHVMFDPKPPRRVKATLAEWKRIREEKFGPCRVCEWPSDTNVGYRPYTVSLHHLVSKSLGGDDTADNMVPLCGDGTRGCHGLIEAHDPWACSLLGQRLTDAEKAYVVAKKGSYYLADRYGIKEAA